MNILSFANLQKTLPKLMNWSGIHKSKNLVHKSIAVGKNVQIYYQDDFKKQTEEKFC